MVHARVGYMRLNSVLQQNVPTPPYSGVHQTHCTSQHKRAKNTHRKVKVNAHLARLLKKRVQNVQCTGTLKLKLKLDIDTHEHLVAKCKPSTGEPSFHFSVLRFPLTLTPLNSTAQCTRTKCLVNHKLAATFPLTPHKEVEYITSHYSSSMRLNKLL